MCPSTPDVELELPMDANAPARARRFLLAASCTEHHAAVLEPSVLVVSELVTNAVHHGTPPVTVRLHCDESAGLEISVSDGSYCSPVLREFGAEVHGGLGVRLVEVVSDAWGVLPTETGKVVWSRLRAA